MWKWAILLYGLGAINAQIIYFNSSSEKTTVGNPLNITCNADITPFRYHYIALNGTEICKYTNRVRCDRGRRYFKSLNADEPYYSCDCGNATPGIRLSVAIKEIRKKDNGTWVCSVNGIEDTLHVVVKYPPTITDITIKPNKEEIKEGTNVTLSCSVDSFPQSNITWSLNGELEDNQRQDLVIEKVTCQDSGRYVATCIAQNGVGNSIEQDKIVNVYCPPRVNSKQMPQTEIASIGDSMTLTATVMAYPAPTFTWKYLLEDKTEKTITDYRMTTKPVNKLTSSLHISNIQEYDYGYYILYASNEMGNVSVNFTLKKAGDNRLGTGIGIGFIVGLLVMGVILVVVFFIWKKRCGKGVNLKQMFQVQKMSSRRISSEDTAPTTRKPSTSKTTAVTFVNRSDETYEGLDSTQPRVDQTYEGLLPDNSVKKVYEEQEIYENQVVG